VIVEREFDWHEVAFSPKRHKRSILLFLCMRIRYHNSLTILLNQESMVIDWTLITDLMDHV
jgi:hypothetical protein